jgi:hypothetical protein
MDEFLLLLYIAYLIAAGHAWLGLFLRPEKWRWTRLSWDFGLGTIL